MFRTSRFMLFIFSLLLISAPVLAQESKVVTSEGVAVVQGRNLDIARGAAISDAQQKAVEQAIGILIDSQTQVENFQVISDNILSQTKGYIKRYNVVREAKEDNLLRVTITAEVALGKLGDDLSAIGILMGQMHKPRTMILVAEQNIGQEWHAWWWYGPGSVHARQTDMAITDNTLMDKFVEKGFEMIDHQAASQDIKVTQAYNVQDLSVQQAKTLGSQAHAEVVIVGKALAKLYGNAGGGLKSVQSNLSLRAVRTDTGQVIATATTNAAAVHISEETAGNEALKKAPADAAEQLTTKILAIYAKEVGGTRPVGSAQLKRRFLQPLRDAGVEVAWFNPVSLRWIRTRRLDFRTHRKIVICDGRVGFTGGMNITDDHSAELSPTYFRDTHVRLEGAVVWSLQRIFLEDWYFATEQPPPANVPLFPAAEGEQDHVVQIVASGPDHDHMAIHRTYFTAITRATTRIWVTTPYFVPDEATVTALCTAALRRVDVRLLIPARGDSRIVDLAARSYVPELMAAGVAVYEYRPRFMATPRPSSAYSVTPAKSPLAFRA